MRVSKIDGYSIITSAVKTFPQVESPEKVLQINRYSFETIYRRPGKAMTKVWV
jgi:hypothetical protein